MQIQNKVICILNKSSVHCVIKAELTDFEMRCTELEENIQRKDFTPAEECAAVSEIHKIKQKEFGASTPNSVNADKWGLEETAEMLGTSKQNVSKLISLNEVVKAHPELEKAKSLSDISKAGKALEAIHNRVEAEDNYAKLNSQQNGRIAELVCGSAVDHMQIMLDDSVDILLTDPPYGTTIKGWMGKAKQDSRNLNLNAGLDEYSKYLESIGGDVNEPQAG